MRRIIFKASNTLLFHPPPGREKQGKDKDELTKSTLLFILWRGVQVFTTRAVKGKIPSVQVGCFSFSLIGS